MTNLLKAHMAISSSIHSGLSTLLSVFFPNKCAFCQDIITTGQSHCNECLTKIRKIPPELCHTCFKKNCSCDTDSLPYKKLVSSYYYDSFSQNCVFSLKFHGVTKHAGYLAQQLYNDLSCHLLVGKIDYVVPVPMHKKAIRLRGYNQSHVLGTHLAKLLNVPVANQLLIKTRHTKSQHSLGLKARNTNLIGAYCVKYTPHYKDKTILLIDDVYTTGNTITQCCKALQQVGINNIYVCTFLNASKNQHKSYTEDD